MCHVQLSFRVCVTLVLAAFGWCSGVEVSEAGRIAASRDSPCRRRRSSPSQGQDVGRGGVVPIYVSRLAALSGCRGEMVV